MNNSKDLVGVVIDPGHGGLDSGAQGNGKKEKDYTLMISKYMYDRFKELGIPVVITRDVDETLNPNERVQKILNAFGNNKDVIVISNHLNAGKGNGAEVIYALRNKPNLAQNILDNLAVEGQFPRRIYQRRLPSDPSKDYYFIHRNTGNTEPVIIEYGFIDDKVENVNFLIDNYKPLAEAVIKAVLEYKNLEYKDPQYYSSKTYIVKKGDTLYSIANRYNITVDYLKKINNLTSNTLQIGQILKINEENKEPTTYKVQKGDSLYSIARRYNTTVDILKEINNLTSNLLSIGQILQLPSDIVLPTTYTVKDNDTLYSIAKMFNTTVEELKRLNNLTSNYIQKGQILVLS